MSVQKTWCRSCAIDRQSLWTCGRAAAGCSGAEHSCNEARSGSRPAARCKVCEEGHSSATASTEQERIATKQPQLRLVAPRAAKLAALVSAEVLYVMQANERGRQARDRARIMRTIKRQRQLEDRRARAGLVGRPSCCCAPACLPESLKSSPHCCPWPAGYAAPGTIQVRLVQAPLVEVVQCELVCNCC